jgi:hypothetical protein
VVVEVDEESEEEDEEEEGESVLLREYTPCRLETGESR